MTIVLTLPDGKLEELEVAQVEFVRYCRYHRCKIRFQTINVDQVYCTESHQRQATKHRAALRLLGAQMSAGRVAHPL